MFKKINIIIVINFLSTAFASAQNPTNLTLNSVPTNAAIDSYTRATTSIKLQPGFKYGPATTNATNLLNLSIGTYPTNVSSSVYNDTLPSNNTISFNSNLIYGCTEGIGNVSPNGSFVYQFPITIAPGFGPVQPNLSIAYSSFGGNGNMGLGFSLTGISGIGRTNKTFYYDGTNQAIGLNSNDVFALDGERLLQKTGAYGAANSTYKTEVESYNKIVSLGNTGSGPTSFIVYTTDGKVLEYGNTSDSRLNSANTNITLTWFINKITDEFGNYMTFTYNNNNGEVNIDRIDYTGNTVQGLAPYNEVKFEYVNRADVSKNYFGDGLFNQTQLLKNIICTNDNNNLVRKYVIDYKYANVSLIDKITELDASGNTLNPTYINWNKLNKITNPPNGIVLSNNATIADPAQVKNYLSGLSGPTQITNSTFEGDILTSLAADLNGDGKKDIVTIKNKQSTASTAPQFLPTTFEVFLNTNSSTINSRNDFQKVTNTALFNTQIISPSKISIISTEVYDEDDDDIEEVFITINNGSGHTIYKIKSNGTNYTFSTDANIINSPTYFQTWYSNSLFHSGFHTVLNSSNSSYLNTMADVDGDKLLDRIIIDQYNVNIIRSNNTNYIYPISDVIKPKLGDFNGDGVADIYLLKCQGISGPFNLPSYSFTNFSVDVLTFNNVTNNFALSSKVISPNVAMFSSSASFNSFFAQFLEIASSNIDFVDYNSDGKTDILYHQYASPYINTSNPGSANLKVSYATGTAFTTEQQLANMPTNIGGKDAGFFGGDFNNDGNVDWIATTYDGSSFTTNYHVFESDGTNLKTTPFTYSKSSQFASAMADFDGDGTLDYLSQNALNTAPTIEYSVFNKNNSQHVTKIYNIKNEYKIEYAMLTNNKAGTNQPIYRKVTSTHPSVFKQVKIPSYVVTNTYLNDREKKYFYENSLFHRQVNGYVGFEKTYIFDVTTNFASASSYTYDATADYLKNSKTETALSSFVANSFLNFSTTNLVSKQQSAFNYVITGNTRYLQGSITTSKDYLKSTNNISEMYYDNTKDGNLSLSDNYATAWLSGTKRLGVEVSNAFQAFTNPLTGHTYYKPSLSSVKKYSTNNYGGSSFSIFNTTMAYDALGHLITKVDNANISNAAITSAYSNFNNFGTPSNISLSAPDLPTPRTSQLNYDATGRFVIKLTNANSNFEEFTYETKYGNKTTSKDITGLLTKYTYDGLGRLVKTELPNNAVNTTAYSWYVYNPIANPSQTKYGLLVNSLTEGAPSIQNKYDFEGNILESTTQVFGGANRINQYSYNVNNQLINQKELATINPLTGDIEASYVYDAYLRQISITKKIAGNQSNKIDYLYNNLSTDATYNKGYTEEKTKNSNGGQFVFMRRENTEAGQPDVIKNYTSLSPSAQQISTYKLNEFNLPYQISNTFNGGAPVNTNFTYDVLGRKNFMSDVSSGVSTYQYNSIGELLSETTPNGSYNFTYDNLGRILTKISGNNTYNYQYITSGNGKQLPFKIIGPNETVEFAYDDLNRNIQKKQTLNANNKVFIANFTYNKYGQMVNYTYPNGFVTTKEYDALGNLIKIKNSNTIIWQLNSLHTPGLINNYSTGNGLFGNSLGYDTQQNLATKNFGSLQSQSYFIAPENGDVLQRTNSNLLTNVNNNENFVFDDFNRLTTIKYLDNSNTLQTKANVTYNANGNIAAKSDAGDYVYGNNAKPYLLTNINNQVGNISLNTLNATYNDFKKVSQLTEASSNKQFNFVYGNDEERIKMDYSISGINQYTRYYTDNYDRQENANNTYKEWAYISSPTGLAAIYYNNNGAGQLLYVQTDHLGSPVIITNAAGNVLEEYSFDAWGRRRNPADWNDYSTGISNTYMIRGYTGHENLDEVGIINMNGRIYDPVLGRFLQPDKFVQAPQYLQNYNRYSYVMNNPLKYKDPSGNIIGIVLGLLRGVGNAIGSGGLEFWNAGKGSYVGSAWSKADPFLRGTAGNNAGRIWWGLYQYGYQNKGGGRGFWEIASRFTWQLPQTLLGGAYMNAANIFGNVDNVEYYHGATVVSGAAVSGGGISLGSFIGVPNIGGDGYQLEVGWGGHTILHEFGHYQQSKEMGWLYLFKVGATSLFGDADWTETDANFRSAKYFEKQTKGEFNWSRDITDRAKKEYARSYSNPKFNRYFEQARSKTDPTLFEYSIMHGVLGILVWNAVRPR